MIQNNIDNACDQGLTILAASKPIKQSEWMDKHFYLSAESSYVEQKWNAYPFQPALANCMSNDEVEEFWMIKPTRIGYTKLILAAMGYFAEHKHRNQTVWQPSDSDAKDFCKTEIDTMLRDVPIMETVFPMYKQRHKDNTLNKKMFLGSILNILGGTAAKNYRRITIDIGYLDEVDAFDLDIEGEGSPVKLTWKRLQGATFPKLIGGSTPKLKGYSMIEARVEQCDEIFNFYIPCPHCNTEHILSWGDKDGKKLQHSGFVWTDRPESAAHICPHCNIFITQTEYLNILEKGRWLSKNNIWMLNEGGFKTIEGKPTPAPRSVGIQGFWSAYSPQVTWAEIVRDYISAVKRLEAGDDSEMKTFDNTTLARSYEVIAEKADEHELMKRAEKYPLRKIPAGGLVLCAGVDTQDNRWEVVVYAYGRGFEMWLIDYALIYGNPADEKDWELLFTYLDTPVPHSAGKELKISATGVDIGGHHTHQVYNFCRQHKKQRIFAVHGATDIKKPIKGKPSYQDVNYKGRIIKKGVQLWGVGVHVAKNLLFGMLKKVKPGPGMIHFSKDLPLEFYLSLTAEHRIPIKTSKGEREMWTKIRPRNDVLDGTNYSIFAAHMMGLHIYTKSQWDRLEKKIQPNVIKKYVLDKIKKLKKKEKKKTKKEETIKEIKELEIELQDIDAEPKSKKKRRKRRGSYSVKGF